MQAILELCVPLVTSKEDKYFAFIDNLWRATRRPATKACVYLRTRKTRELMAGLYTRLDMPKEVLACAPAIVGTGAFRRVSHKITTL